MFFDLHDNYPTTRIYPGCPDMIRQQRILLSQNGVAIKKQEKKKKEKERNAWYSKGIRRYQVTNKK